MSLEAYGCMWIPMDRQWCLWRLVDINGWLCMSADACGYHWIGIGVYGNLQILKDGHWCLWMIFDTNGKPLVLMEALGC